MDNAEFAFMLALGLGIIIFNKQFARSAIKQRMAMGVKITEVDLIKTRIFTVIVALAFISFALFIKYATEWQFR